jgi:hypothetical protein
MIGYAYLDLDNELMYKTQDYIENDNPGFWGQNSHLILKYWKFDTEDMNNMRKLFHAITNLAVPNSNVLNFVRTIKFDMNSLKSANKI